MRNEEEFLPWREKNLKAAMRNRDGGEVVIHARGQAVKADQAAASLRGDGPNQIHLGCSGGPPFWASLSSDQLDLRGGLKSSKSFLKTREAINFPNGILKGEPSPASPKGFRPLVDQT